MSSSSGSTDNTVPTPNCGCRTRTPGLQPGRHRLVLVLVRVGRLFFLALARDSRAARTDLRGNCENDVCGVRNVDGTSSISSGGNLVDEARRLGRLVLAEHTPARGRRQHQPPLRARDADVAEPALLLELGLVVGRPRVRKEPFLEPGDDDDRKLEPFRAVHASSSARARRGPRPLRRRPRAATADRRSRRATARDSAVSYSRAADTSSARFSIRPSASSLRSSRRSCR